MRKFLSTSIAVLGLTISASALAGPVRDFETAFRNAYADYRTVLFMTNSNDPAATSKAQTAFEGKWAALVARWGTTPPPQYADDASWGEMLKKVNAILGNAGTAIRAGKLTEAHEILEHFRNEIGALHTRNNVVTFSDRMDTYHEKMEKVLGDAYGGFDAAGRSRLSGDVAILAFLADDLERHPPSEALDSAEFRTLFGALRGSLANAQKALGGDDAAAIKKALSGLKPAYSKFFLRFG